MLNGIDVSHYNGNIDWHSVKSDDKYFVSIKATEGVSYSSAFYFTDNIHPARDAGLIAGGFHFFVGTDSGKDQAEYFLKVADPKPGDLLPMLDVEQTNGASDQQMADGMAEWMEVVERAVGKKPFIYVSASFWSQIGNPKGFEDNPLWVAEYTSAPSPKLPMGWHLYTIWQHSEASSVNGISGNVDADKFNGGLDQLDIFRV